jgi:hypothetical protein
VREHAATGFDRRQLIGVTNEDHLGARSRAGLDQASQLGGADHGGFVDDDHGAPIDLELIVLDEPKRFSHGQSAVTGSPAHRLVDCSTGGAITSRSLLARSAAARSGCSECVLPAPAGACTG